MVFAIGISIYHQWDCAGFYKVSHCYRFGQTEILSQVSDIITSPPNNDMYKTLKERLINIFSDSEERRLKKLLQDVELGDKRPSMLLRQMQDLAGNRVGDELLRS
ncbi:hypothetical protein AVEN_76439-1 [Araneus ventricosus]|uniref:DUF7041 domain-containing protein n=1 Tax=Araneus ventricosus TaxID=182803 RepID=A0A4Y2TI96_ARAVE|nr:hypothetical protein AVEN_76439-1 [Araneus ventricosus]